MNANKIDNEKNMGDYVPFHKIVDNGVVYTKSEDYMMTWELIGLPLEGKSNEYLATALLQLNQFYRSISDGHHSIWVHRIKRKTPLKISPYQQDGLGPYVLNTYEDKFKDHNLYTMKLYITLVYRPVAAAVGNMTVHLNSSYEEMMEARVAALEHLQQISIQIFTTLKAYSPRFLCDYVNAQGIKFSEQLEFYAYLINRFEIKIPVKDIPLEHYLPLSRIFFGNEFLEYRYSNNSVFSTFLDLKDYADFSYSGILSPIMTIESEFIETHSFSPESATSSLAKLKLQINRMKAVNDEAISQRHTLEVARDAVAGGEFSFGSYHFTLQVFGESLEVVKRNRSKCIDTLQSVGFLPVAIDLIPDYAYFSQLPSNWKYRCRTALMSSKNFSGLCSLHTFDTGKMKNNPWGDYCSVFVGIGKQPHFFNFHATPKYENSFGKIALANTQIIGQSGSGKTVLALFLMICLRVKYDATCIYFDKDCGAKVGISALEGKYTSFALGTPTNLNPFKMDNTDRNFQFLKKLVNYCVTINGVTLTAREDEQITQAIKSIMLLPTEVRSFDTLMQNLPHDGDNSIALRLKKWANPKEYGWLLNCSTDILNWNDSRLFGFDYTEILEEKIACPALMMYLLHRLEELFSGQRVAFFMDEYWKALSISEFEDFAKNKQKTIRKQNGFGVYMTQSPSDTLESNIAKSLIEQSATMIFMPNPNADRSDYIDGFKLSEEEFLTLKELPVGSRYFAVKQGDNFSLMSLDLSEHQEIIKILSGTAATVELHDKLVSQYGAHPMNWIDKFLEH